MILEPSKQILKHCCPHYFSFSRNEACSHWFSTWVSWKGCSYSYEKPPIRPLYRNTEELTRLPIFHLTFTGCPKECRKPLFLYSESVYMGLLYFSQKADDEVLQNKPSFPTMTDSTNIEPIITQPSCSDFWMNACSGLLGIFEQQPRFGSVLFLLIWPQINWQPLSF